MGGKKTATYKITPDTGGNRYRFYCDVSEALVCITSPYHADTPEEELMLAWEKEGRQHFNQCRKCGRFIPESMKVILCYTGRCLHCYSEMNIDPENPEEMGY